MKKQKQKTIGYQDYTFIVGGVQPFTLSEALALWKAKYESFKDFKEAIIVHSSMDDFGGFVQECWDSIKEATALRALAEKNAEKRRIYFDCIGVRKVFDSLSHTLLDRQVITKNRAKWDDDNKESMYTFDDVYELYTIKAENMFPTSSSWTGSNSDRGDVYMVRCWCTTTNREYFLYVPRIAALGSRWSWSGNEGDKPDVVRAIAWTIRINITNPERLYRQGDIIAARWSKDSIECEPYHITKEQYLTLMYSES